MLTATVESQHEEIAILTLEQSADKESIKIVKHCEGHLRVGEKVPLWISEPVDGLQLKEGMAFGSLASFWSLLILTSI
jgi:hypothetical protein